MTKTSVPVNYDCHKSKAEIIIHNTMENVRKQGKSLPAIDNLPLNDAETYKLYARVDSTGIYQSEGSVMLKYRRKFRPSCFEDLIALLVLSRPGPLDKGMVEEVIKRKHGKAPVVYPHEMLIYCLHDTYGVIVYHEQIVQIAQIIAKYKLSEADQLRRAMGKQNPVVMLKERDSFISGAAKNGIGEDEAKAIFDLMTEFAPYTFSKIHAASYALLSYHTAWLKAHYNDAFTEAQMASDISTQNKKE